MSQSNLLISSSPHIHSGESVSHVMRSVIWALMPATALSVMIFGWPALLVILITTASCLATEVIVNRLRHRSSTLGDNSAVLTGILLALTLPPHSPWWICVIGGAFAIALGKQLYGGLGYNMFNPALIARVFLLISFPVELTTWPVPNPLLGDHAFTLSQGLAIIFGGPDMAKQMADVVTAATPLGQYRTEVGMGHLIKEALFGSYGFSYGNAAAGMINGSLGETSAILLALGGLYLLRKKVITWHIPAAMFAGCLGPAALFWVMNPGLYPDPLFHLLTGGLIIGAFFMATDMVTSPITPLGQIVFGLGCGLLTYIIRTWGGYPEGVSFAILIMNSAVPLIDQYTRPAIYGQTRKVKAGGAANA
ncbi:MAG: RnfABCDGE type electron transport complex subunit D [Magnetococcales bacterium]|nr:RnfABCDGE type electron transport complex subunit D [Magnetococcales bacterium]